MNMIEEIYLFSDPDDEEDNDNDRVRDDDNSWEDRSEDSPMEIK